MKIIDIMTFTVCIILIIFLLGSPAYKIGNQYNNITTHIEKNINRSSLLNTEENINISRSLLLNTEENINISPISNISQISNISPILNISSVPNISPISNKLSLPKIFSIPNTESLSNKIYLYDLPVCGSEEIDILMKNKIESAIIVSF